MDPLPDAALLRVFHFLPTATSLLRAHDVCRRWRALLRSSSLWRRLALRGNDASAPAGVARRLVERAGSALSELDISLSFKLLQQSGGVNLCVLESDAARWVLDGESGRKGIVAGEVLDESPVEFLRWIEVELEKQPQPRLKSLTIDLDFCESVDHLPVEYIESNPSNDILAAVSQILASNASTLTYVDVSLIRCDANEPFLNFRFFQHLIFPLCPDVSNSTLRSLRFQGVPFDNERLHFDCFSSLERLEIIGCSISMPLNCLGPPPSLETLITESAIVLTYNVAGQASPPNSLEVLSMR